jgi:curli production assembly/transport component CsgF
MHLATMLRAGASRGAIAAVTLAALAAAPSAAQAQELIHRFINPSFGGNPFYSDHLIGIANIHRPEQPEEPDEPQPTEEERLVESLRASLNAQVSSEILDRIRSAQPGQSGDFTLGVQRISFVRTATETRVTFLNTTTGERREIIIPVSTGNGPFGSTGTALAAGAPASGPSAEQALGALGAVPNGPLSGSQTSSLLGTPPF